MKLDQAKRAALKKMVQDGGWDVMMLMLSQRIVELSTEEITGNDGFQTLRNLHTKQGSIAGLKQFFEDVERESSE